MNINYLTVTYSYDEFIFGSKGKFTIRDITDEFIRGFLCYINNNISMENVVIESNVKASDGHIVRFLDDDEFNIENQEIRDMVQSSDAKTELYNNRWNDYLKESLTNNIVCSFTMLCRDTNDRLIFQFNSVDFLEGFRLAFAYQDPYLENFINIHQIHSVDNTNNGYQRLCHEYIMYSIYPEYTDVDKVLYDDMNRKDTEISEMITHYIPEFPIIKNILLEYFDRNITTIMLGYYITKKCSYYEGFTTNFQYKYTHCDTLCDVNSSGYKKCCDVCYLLDNPSNEYQGKKYNQFMINIRLEVAR